MAKKLTTEEQAAMPTKERIENCPSCGSLEVERSPQEDDHTKHRHNICAVCRHMWRDMAKAKRKAKEA